MKGHDRVIDARMAGRKPSVGVFFDMTDTKPWFDWLETKAPGFPCVWIEPSDQPDALDLRFVVGLRCCIGAVDGRDWTALADACLKAGATEVVVTKRVDGETVEVYRRAHADHQ